MTNINKNCNIIHYYEKLRAMVKIYTLRNIIALFGALFFVGCSNNGNYQNSSTIDDVKTFSSEDKFSATAKLNEIKQTKDGQIIYVIEK